MERSPFILCHPLFSFSSPLSIPSILLSSCIISRTTTTTVMPPHCNSHFFSTRFDHSRHTQLTNNQNKQWQEVVPAVSFFRIPPPHRPRRPRFDLPPPKKKEKKNEVRIKRHIHLEETKEQNRSCWLAPNERRKSLTVGADDRRFRQFLFSSSSSVPIRCVALTHRLYGRR